MKTNRITVAKNRKCGVIGRIAVEAGRWTCGAFLRPFLAASAKGCT
jgi:hypothetical protein